MAKNFKLVLLCLSFAAVVSAGERPLRQMAATAPTTRAAKTEVRNPSIPGLEQPLTQYYIAEYSSPGGIKWLEETMERAAPYIPFIRREIASRQQPEAFLYIPVIESSYVSTAVSSSGAAGLWQFMTNSIAPFNMRVDEWVDERLDFWKSTCGALDKLQDNYAALGNWELALAAYNAGLGAMQRTIQTSGIRDYWTLCERKLLKTETIQYVPKLLAAAYVLSNPRLFGIKSTWSPDPQWQLLPLNRQADISLLAEAAGLDGTLLEEANRELLHGVSPPVSSPGLGYSLKAPAAFVPALSAALLEADSRGNSLMAYYYHTIAYGDTLWALSRHYQVSTEQIIAENPGLDASNLRLGRSIRIPAIRNDIQPYEHIRPEKDETIGSFEGSYVVKAGDTLWRIAIDHGIKPEALAQANGMELTDTLSIGMVLKTPIQ
jgi:membrane-bound lytic murein transglycosylase D